jgi:hypothetical protein
MQPKHPLSDKIEDREVIFSTTHYHAPIINHFFSVKMDITQHIVWVNSLINEIFFGIEEETAPGRPWRKSSELWENCLCQL